MSREVRRVPLTFDWPRGQVWNGYVMPERLIEPPCPACRSGYASGAQHLHDMWFGYVPFDPVSTGSIPLSPGTRAVWAFAARNVASAGWYYGTGDSAVVREARRLADLWNGMWCHHLSQEDVDALVAADRLRGLTHTWSRDEGWRKIEPPVTVTAAQVNEWALSGSGHDAINASIVVRARCEREGIEVECPRCEGHATIVAYPGQREQAETWERTEPPEGEGWQLWETVSEGSPISPVFATREVFVDWLATDYRTVSDSQPLSREHAERLAADGSTPGTLIVTGGQVYSAEARP